VEPNFPKIALINISGAFATYGQPGTPGFTNSVASQLSDDISIVRGTHQIGFGGNFVHTNMNLKYSTVASGEFQFNTTNTGIALGDFLLGRPNQFRQHNVNAYYFRQNYIGAYLQDTWKASSRLTVNAGIRWEPFWTPYEARGKVLSYDKARFDQGIRSTVFKNAPPGLLFPGDPGGPTNSFTNSTWLKWRFSPRLGLAWDPEGNGRTTVRAAYGYFLDYWHFFHYDAIKQTPPWAREVILPSPAGGFEDPWRGFPGGNPFPFVVDANLPFIDSMQIFQLPDNLKPPYIHQWNLSIQKQVGTDWLVSANYLGNSTLHIMSSAEGNPAVYLPGASCTLAGRTFSPCSSTGNTAQRRILSLQNPTEGPRYANIIVIDDGGTRNFNGLLLSVQRRHSTGVTVQANYTLGHCIDYGPIFDISGPGRTTLDRLALEKGNCDLDRRHIFNLSTVYQVPSFSNNVVRAIATGWRVSGIVGILSGSYLTATTGLDNALNGFGSQRPNQVLASPYAAVKNNQTWLNPAAFAQPENGTFGNMGRANIIGPGSIRIDLGLTREFRVRENHVVEFKAEAFNLPNHLNAGNPATNVSTTATFGLIRSAADPRILQFALKYVF
jgi:hypothetical protein